MKPPLDAISCNNNVEFPAHDVAMRDHDESVCCCASDGARARPDSVRSHEIGRHQVSVGSMTLSRHHEAHMGELTYGAYS